MGTAALKQSNKAADKKGNSKPNSATKSCPLKSCSVESLVANCGHSSRSFKLDLSKGPTRGQDHVIQIIAGSETADEMVLTFKGKCQKGHPKEVSPRKEKVFLKKDRKIDEGFKYFFSNILNPSTATPESTVLKVKYCSGSPEKSVKVEAFPQVEWSGKLGVGYFYDAHKDSNFNRNQGYKKLKVHGQWKVVGGLSVKCDTQTWNIGEGEYSKKGGRYDQNQLTKEIFEGAQEFLNQVTPILGDIKGKYASISIDWPMLELSGGLKNIELPDKYNVGLQGNIKIDLNPLCGATFKVEVLDLFLLWASVHPFGRFLKKIKDALAEGVGNDSAKIQAELSINFSMKGAIKGSMEWETKTGESWTSKGEVGASLDFELQGKGDGKLTFFFIEASAGASMGAKSGVGGVLTSASENNKPVLGGQLKFNGLTVYYSWYYKVGLKTTGSRRRRRRPSNSSAKGSSDLKDESKKEFKWLDPKVWPAADKPQDLTKSKI